jgi:hypothetical protein
MKKIILLSIFIALSSPASAWTCRGLVTSNNSCIGSESNVDSYRNHEPFYSGGGIHYGGQRPFRSYRSPRGQRR